MEISIETAISIALFFAVFAGATSIGSSIVLGAGIERLRNGFEILKKQSQFFGTAIHYLDEKVDDLDGRMAALELNAGEGVYAFDAEDDLDGVISPQLHQQLQAKIDARLAAKNFSETSQDHVKIHQIHPHDFLDIH